MDTYAIPIGADDPTKPLNCTAQFSVTPGIMMQIPDRGTLIEIDIPPEAFGPHRGNRYTEYSISRQNYAMNHLQGLQSHREYLFATGADWTEGVSHLFVMKINPADERSGRLHRIAALDDKFPHAGGFQRLGDVAPIPLEGAKASKIIFVNLEDPLNPKRISSHSHGPLEIARPGSEKAGAAAIACVDLDAMGKRFLVVIGWDQPGRFPWSGTRPRFDFYLSRTDDLRDGFLIAEDGNSGIRVNFSTIQNKWPAYQAINLLPGAKLTNGTLHLWMTALRNTGAAGNYFHGANLADLIEIEFQLETLMKWPLGPHPVCKWAGTPPRPYFFPIRDGNFAAAAGYDITADSQAVLYAAHHWRTDDHFRLTVCKRDPL